MDHDKRAADAIELAASITIAWLNNPNVRPSTDDATGFLKNVHATLASMSGDDPQADSTASTEQYTPAVTVKKSLASRDRIISLIDGKAYTTLKRHLSSNGLTPAQYRERYGLKADYPMTAPSYSEKRRLLAKQIGLGNKTGGRKAKAAAPASNAGAKPATAAKPGRKPATTAKPRGRPRKTKAQAVS